VSGVALDFERELKVFRTECQGAIQFFYSWQTIHAVAGSDKKVQRALNDAPLFCPVDRYRAALKIVCGIDARLKGPIPGHSTRTSYRPASPAYGPRDGCP
jgi:hypothetical protein